MAGKGSPKGVRLGGRQKGTPNKVTAEARKAAVEAGLTPLDYMLTLLRDETADPKRRDWAAGAAAPFVHAKLASVDVGNKPGEVFMVQLLADDAGLL